MLTNDQILYREFNYIKQDIIDNYRELGMEASGKWINELEVEVEDENAKLVGAKYTEQLVYGRKPGTFPPVEDIKQWIYDKGIVNNIKGNISVSSLAFLIARKIARVGTKYFQEGGTDLVRSVITPERIQRIINLVGENTTSNIIGIMEKQFKQIAA